MIAGILFALFLFDIDWVVTLNALVAHPWTFFSGSTCHNTTKQAAMMYWKYSTNNLEFDFDCMTILETRSYQSLL